MARKIFKFQQLGNANYSNEVFRYIALCLTIFLLISCNLGDGSNDKIGKEFFVDCSQEKNGDGTDSSPFNKIEALNNISLNAGDRVRFRKDTVCKGSVIAKTSGTEDASIVYEDYGSGSQPPHIDANGEKQAFLVQDSSWVTVQNLSLSAPGDGKQARRGIFVTAEDSGEHKGIKINNLEIQNVRGYMPSTVEDKYHGTGKYAEASGGIIVEAKGESVPTWFNGLEIKNNKINDVDRQGIYTWSNWCQRAELVPFWYKLCTAQWQPFENTVISGNQLSNIGGDGIAPMTTKNGLVEKNELDGFNLRSQSPNAGMWSANSDDVVYQYNLTSGGKTTKDGMSYDVDHSTNGIIYQYNISWNNEGGFMLICPYGDLNKGRASNFVVRYNLSVADKTRTFQVCDGGAFNGQIYNNTFLFPTDTSKTPKAHIVLVEPATKDKVVELMFSNNIFMQLEKGIEPEWKYDDTSIQGSNNLYFNVPPMVSDDYFFIQDPKLARPGLANYQWQDYIPAKDSVTISQGTQIDNSVETDALNQNVGSPPTIGTLEPEPQT
ncbi:right-handed parallel beta-helix repeat-containing protein [Vibrio mimicus]|uniref:right-handed parallel beta-helix repeat-containing protein n=1 Tax=Vibrio mimicus TaxID=674 RepID=UPI0011D71F2C|nr:right-handed parallel beta-helix repeat-containing protein [Vibrio mimicus]TXY05421.1 pectate lyase [Vibrio mimicus]